MTDSSSASVILHRAHGRAVPWLERVSLTHSEADDLRRDQRVCVVARAMPLKLCHPAESHEVVESQSEPVSAAPSWGIKEVRAHLSPHTGDGVVVAVLDSGILSSHLAFRGLELEQRNFTSGQDDDELGHGTHCAGTIFGQDVKGRRIGVARGIRKALIGKVIGPDGGSSADLAEAVIWALQRDADVISMSVGLDLQGHFNTLVADGSSEAEAKSVAQQEYQYNLQLLAQLIPQWCRANQSPAKAVMVLAAGNERTDARLIPELITTDRDSGLMMVGAVRPSGRGPIRVAPLTRTPCHLTAPGDRIPSAWIGSPEALLNRTGTSMAAPHVAGCASLWIEHLRSLKSNISNHEVIQCLTNSAIRLPESDFKEVRYGLVQAPLSDWRKSSDLPLV